MVEKRLRQKDHQTRGGAGYGAWREGQGWMEVSEACNWRKNIRVRCLASKYGSLKSHVSKKLCAVSVKGIQGIQDRAANKLLLPIKTAAQRVGYGFLTRALCQVQTPSHETLDLLEALTLKVTWVVKILNPVSWIPLGDVTQSPTYIKLHCGI